MNSFSENLTVEEIRTRIYRLFFIIISALLVIALGLNSYFENYEKAIADFSILIVIFLGNRYYLKTKKFDIVVDTIIAITFVTVTLLLLFSDSSYNTVLYIYYLYVPIVFMFYNFKQALYRLAFLVTTLLIVFILFLNADITLNVNLHQYSMFFVTMLLLVLFTATPIYFYYDLKDKYAGKSGELEKQRQLYASLFEKSYDGILIFENYTIADCNEAVVSMLRHKNKVSVLNTKLYRFSPLYQPDGKKSIAKAKEMIALCHKNGTHRFDWLHKKSDGELFWSEIALTNIEIKDRSFIHVLWRDISKRKSLEVELRTLANIDPLTNINNRRNFFILADRMFQERKHEIFVAMVDIDNFKNINDVYGHAHGDKVLIEITQRISSVLDENTLFGRLGGEEFGIVTCKENYEKAQAYIETIRKVVSQKACVYEDISLDVSVSIGFSQMYDNANIDDLLSIADHALYDAKKGGKNVVRYRS